LRGGRPDQATVDPWGLLLLGLGQAFTTAGLLLLHQLGELTGTHPTESLQ
jgi:hypothetical protein